MSPDGNRRSPEALAEGVLRGDRRAIARLISLTESGSPLAPPALNLLYPSTGRSHVVGVTGPPGAGKSTLVGRLGLEARRLGSRVAVLALDPSSPYTGGALLGDRIRMSDLSEDPGAFVRSMASRGARGGLARAARDAVRILEAAGFDLIFVETVGAGQSELDVTTLAETTVVVAVPELGDEIQALKAGLYEAADVFAVNKSDLAGAEQALAALALSTERVEGEWKPPIVRCVATTGEGVAELLEVLRRHRAYLTANGLRTKKERGVARAEVTEALRDGLLAWLVERTGPAAIDRASERVARREIDAWTAARALLEAGLVGVKRGNADGNPTPGGPDVVE